MRTESLLPYLKLVISLYRKQPCLEDKDVPPLYREPHIHTGYRLPYKSFSYYFWSIFYIHNETVNIWTHLVALLLFIYNIHKYSYAMDYVNESLAWPFLSFSIGTLAYASCSTIAHLFQSKSEAVHYLSFQIDYIGIGLNSHATATSFYFFIGNELFYHSFLGKVYLFSCTIIAILTCVLLSYAKLKYPRPYPLQRKLIALGVMSFSFFFGCIPGYYLFYESLQYKDWSHFWAFVFPHVHYIIYFFISAFFYASHIPERKFPGSFDILGQGHQFFHVFMAWCSHMQYMALYDVYKSRPSHLVNLSNPQLYNTLLPLSVIVIVDVIFIYLVRGFRARRAKEEQLKGLCCQKFKDR